MVVPAMEEWGREEKKRRGEGWGEACGGTCEEVCGETGWDEQVSGEKRLGEKWFCGVVVGKKEEKKMLWEEFGKQPAD